MTFDDKNCNGPNMTNRSAFNILQSKPRSKLVEGDCIRAIKNQVKDLKIITENPLLLVKINTIKPKISKKKKNFFSWNCLLYRSNHSYLKINYKSMYKIIVFEFKILYKFLTKNPYFEVKLLTIECFFY